MDLVAKLREQISQLRSEREQFVAQANQQLAFIDGKLNGLEEALAALEGRDDVTQPAASQEEAQT